MTLDPMMQLDPPNFSSDKQRRRAPTFFSLLRWSSDLPFRTSRVIVDISEILFFFFLAQDNGEAT